MTEFRDMDVPKWKEFMRLQDHRRFHVRDHARAGLLAYAFLRGVPYRKVERKTHDSEAHLNAIKKEVRRLVSKFGEEGKDYKKDLDIWFSE